MALNMQKISRRGRQRMVRSLALGPHITIVMKGRILKIGEVFDEFWMRSKDMLSLPEIIASLQRLPGRPDIMTSVQKLPYVNPQYPYYHDWTNFAVAHFGSYKEWFETQIDRSAKKQIRQSVRAGIRTEVVSLNDDLVKGICSIYNEILIRQGRKFWHYGKDPEVVKTENSTYLERSVFIGAFYENELVGFTKIVFDEEVASLMQILSKSAYFGKRPNNALLSKAVDVCEQRQAKYLTYGQYAYGKKDRSSLIEFKKSLGFNRVEVPRYYIPLTFLGRAALALRLHKGIRDRIPASLGAAFIRLRTQLNRLRWRHP